MLRYNASKMATEAPQREEEMATEQMEPSAQDGRNARNAPLDRPSKRQQKSLKPCNDDLSYMWGYKGEHKIRLGVSKELNKVAHIDRHRKQRGFLKLRVKFELAPDYKPRQRW